MNSNSIQQNLISVVMGDKCSNTMDLSIKSVLDSDKIIFVWGMSDIYTKNKLDIWKKKLGDKFILLEKEFFDDDIKAIPNQKNFFLDYLKQHHKDDWILQLDADEVLDDDGISNIHNWIEEYGEKIYTKYPMFNLPMIHLIGDLVHEDATKPKHEVLTRLFKVVDNIEYANIEHTSIVYNNLHAPQGWTCPSTTIFHLAYCSGIWDIKKRFDGQLSRWTEGNSHPKQFLSQWLIAHITGQYPVKKIKVTSLPKLLLNEFNIEKEALYFKHRNIEVKHFLDVYNYIKYFNLK